MFRLEHVNLVVQDIDQTLHFIQVAFPDWTIRGQGQSEWFGAKRSWLHVGTDNTYITLNSSEYGNNRDLKSNTPGLAHIGFEVDDMEALSERLQQAGYEIGTIGAEHPYRKTIYFIDPSGFEFEFIQYLSQDPAKRNQYGGETSEPIRFS